MELAGNVSGVAIKDGGISVLDLSWVVHDDNLSKESINFSWGIVLGISSNVSSSDILYVQTLDVESDVVSWNGLLERFVVHFNRLDLRLHICGSEVNGHSWFKDTGLDSSDWDGSNTSNLVDVLKGKSKWFVSGSFGGNDGIESLNESGALVPWGVGGFLEHIVSIESRNGDEADVIGVESDLLQESRSLLLDFVVSL